MTEQQKIEVYEKIQKAAQALNRSFSCGELRDLILDNFSWVKDSKHANEILNELGF